MKFKKEFLQSLLYEDISEEDMEEDEITVVEKKLIDTSRWSNIYNLIFSFRRKFYQTGYSVGATEQQDERPFEYAEDEVECKEVVPVEKTITIYEEAK